MKKEIISDFKEVLYSEILPNGLKIYLLPKVEYSSSFAVFATRFGSLNSSQVLQNIQIPRGIAHYLEHRLFDNPQGEVFDMFSTLGSEVNAFTTYDKTVYYISTTKDICTNINLLLDFVQTCQMTQEAFENEKDIIVEEMKMRADDPNSRLYMGILNCMYHKHEVKYEIIGTEESVRNTKLEELELVHKNFYHPSNMVLVISGNFDPIEVVKCIKENQESKTFSNMEVVSKIDYIEPKKVKRKRKVIQMPISIKKVAIGYKLPIIDNIEDTYQKNQKLIAYSIYFSMLFGKTSNFYQRLIDEKVVVANTFGFYHDYNDGYNHVIFDADVFNERKFISIVKEAIEDDKVCRNQNLFIQKKNAYLGNSILGIESPSDLAMEYMDNVIEGMNLFADIEIIKQMKIDSIIEVSNEIKNSDYSVFTIAVDKKS